MTVTASEAHRRVDGRSIGPVLRTRPVISKRRARLGVAVAIAAVAGCATTVQRNDWHTYTGLGAEYFRKPEYKLPYVPDPLEPTNRIIWGANDFLLFDLIEPVSAAWRFLVPQAVRSHLVNAARNVTFPGRAVNHLLQGDWGQAGDETRRFAINTTVGILGLFDKAAEWGIEPAPAELGQTFVNWGWSDSLYVVLPIAGPSTIRDTLGLAGDALLDPTTYYFPAGLVTRSIEGSEVISDAKRLVRTSYDAYGLARQSWTATRWRNEMELDQTDAGGPASETLDSAFLTYHDPWFPSRATTHAVTLPSTGRKLPYDAWIQAGPAPVVYIVPGMGAHREAADVLALAEMVYHHGFSAVTISGAMNFEFMERAATTPVPGFAPTDAHDVHVALDAISRDLDKGFPGRIRARVFLGMSLGAFHGFYIAAEANRPDGALIDFDRYVLLDPTVSSRYAAERLDAYYNAPLSFPERHRDEHVKAILQKAVQRFGSDSTTVEKRYVFSEQESQFLVGLSFREVLHDAIWCSQRRHDMGVLKSRLDPLRRAPASDEIFDFSFMEYFYAFVLPCCIQQDNAIASAQEMFALMDARSLTGALPADGTVRVFASENDFLVTDADRQWLIRTFGASNVTLEPRGGHTGALYKRDIQQSIMDALEDVRLM